jgi:hypothetical protein
MATTVKARITAGINVVTNKELGAALSALPALTSGSAPWPCLIAEITGATFTKACVIRQATGAGSSGVFTLTDDSLTAPTGEAITFANVAAAMVIVHSGVGGSMQSELTLHRTGGGFTAAIAPGGVNLAYSPGGFSTSGGRNTITMTATGQQIEYTIVLLGT